jgi:hypothetical protein
MNCPRCGKPLPGGASFCMHCGQMLSAAAPAGGVPAYAAPMAVSSAVRRRNTWMAAGVSAAILLLLFFGLKASGVLKLGEKGPDQRSLEAVGTGPDSTLQIHSSGSPPSLQAVKKTMPKDIYDWLEHLARIERKKQALTARQEEEAMDLIRELKGTNGLSSTADVDFWTSPDSTELPVVNKASSVMREMQPEWEDLVKEFESVPPPPECVKLRDEYDAALAAIPEQMKQLDQVLGSVSMTDQDKSRDSQTNAREVGRNSRRKIDGSFTKSDSMVQSICDLYETKKWFKIDAHGGSTGILGF